jgi:glycosyltransferase involved in cell wall biosynthesis
VVGNLSFSNKVVEWTAMGLPVIAGSTETMRRYFPGAGLYYVEPGSPDAISEQLISLHRSEPDEVRDRISDARIALERISWPVQRRNLLAAVTMALDPEETGR